MSISTDEAKRAAKMKRKRSDRKAAHKAKVAEAKARDERIGNIMRHNALHDAGVALIGKKIPDRIQMRPEDERWNWDSRVKPPEAGQ